VNGPPDVGGGVVVVTGFECPGIWPLLIVLVMHHRMRRKVRRQAEGFIDVTMVVGWRRRSLLSISLWEDVQSLYSMGRVSRHIEATRVPRRLGVVTSGAVYTSAGDWRTVMFGTPGQGRSPFGSAHAKFSK
jgi:hypothetical protein